MGMWFGGYADRDADMVRAMAHGVENLDKVIPDIIKSLQELHGKDGGGNYEVTPLKVVETLHAAGISPIIIAKGMQSLGVTDGEVRKDLLPEELKMLNWSIDSFATLSYGACTRKIRELVLAGKDVTSEVDRIKMIMNLAEQQTAKIALNAMIATTVAKIMKEAGFSSAEVMKGMLDAGIFKRFNRFNKLGSNRGIHLLETFREEKTKQQDAAGSASAPDALSSDSKQHQFDSHVEAKNTLAASNKKVAKQSLAPAKIKIAVAMLQAGFTFEELIAIKPYLLSAKDIEQAFSIFSQQSESENSNLSPRQKKILRFREEREEQEKTKAKVISDTQRARKAKHYSKIPAVRDSEGQIIGYKLPDIGYVRKPQRLQSFDPLESGAEKQLTHMTIDKPEAADLAAKQQKLLERRGRKGTLYGYSQAKTEVVLATALDPKVVGLTFHDEVLNGGDGVSMHAPEVEEAIHRYNLTHMVLAHRVNERLLLSKRLSQNLKMLGGSVADTKKYAPLAREIDQLHKQNIAHRDIKPENMAVDESDEVCLIDFGFSSKICSGANGNQGGTESMLSSDLFNAIKDDKLGRYQKIRDKFTFLLARFYVYSSAQNPVIDKLDEISHLTIDVSKSSATLDNFLMKHIVEKHRVAVKDFLLKPVENAAAMEKLKLADIYKD